MYMHGALGFLVNPNMCKIIVTFNRSISSLHKRLLARHSLRLFPTHPYQKEMEEGIIQLCKALFGHYTDTSGKSKPVNGDMAKLRYVLGLIRAAK